MFLRKAASRPPAPVEDGDSCPLLSGLVNILPADDPRGPRSNNGAREQWQITPTDVRGLRAVLERLDDTEVGEFMPTEESWSCALEPPSTACMKDPRIQLLAAREIADGTREFLTPMGSRQHSMPSWTADCANSA